MPSSDADKRRAVRAQRDPSADFMNAYKLLTQGEITPDQFARLTRVIGDTQSGQKLNATLAPQMDKDQKDAQAYHKTVEQRSRLIGGAGSALAAGSIAATGGLDTPLAVGGVAALNGALGYLTSDTPGRAAANIAGSLIPYGKLGTALKGASKAKAALTMGAVGAAAGLGEKAIETGVDQDRLPSAKEAAYSAAVGGVLGGAAGAVGGRAKPRKMTMEEWAEQRTPLQIAANDAKLAQQKAATAHGVTANNLKAATSEVQNLTQANVRDARQQALAEQLKWASDIENKQPELEAAQAKLRDANKAATAHANVVKDAKSSFDAGEKQTRDALQTDANNQVDRLSDAMKQSQQVKAAHEDMMGQKMDQFRAQQAADYTRQADTKKAAWRTLDAQIKQAKAKPGSVKFSTANPYDELAQLANEEADFRRQAKEVLDENITPLSHEPGDEKTLQSLTDRHNANVSRYQGAVEDQRQINLMGKNPGKWVMTPSLKQQGLDFEQAAQEAQQKVDEVKQGLAQLRAGKAKAATSTPGLSPLDASLMQRHTDAQAAHSANQLGLADANDAAAEAENALANHDAMKPNVPSTSLKDAIMAVADKAGKAGFAYDLGSKFGSHTGGMLAAGGVLAWPMLTKGASAVANSPEAQKAIGTVAPSLIPSAPAGIGELKNAVPERLKRALAEAAGFGPGPVTDPPQQPQ